MMEMTKEKFDTVAGKNRWVEIDQKREEFIGILKALKINYDVVDIHYTEQEFKQYGEWEIGDIVVSVGYAGHPMHEDRIRFGSRRDDRPGDDWYKCMEKLDAFLYRLIASH